MAFPPQALLDFHYLWGRGTGPPFFFVVATTGPERHLLVVLRCRLQVAGAPGVWDTVHYEWRLSYCHVSSGKLFTSKISCTEWPK